MPRPQHEQAGCILIKRALEDGRDLNVFSAVELTRCHRSTCREYLYILHKARYTHIIGWHQSNNRGRWYPTYRWGKGEDVEKPGRDERCARRRLKRTVQSRGITIGMLLGVEK